MAADASAITRRAPRAQRWGVALAADEIVPENAPMLCPCLRVGRLLSLYSGTCKRCRKGTLLP